MLVKDLVALLVAQPQDAQVKVSVGWSADTATSDDNENLTVENDKGTVKIGGWLSNCGTELQFGE